MKAPYFVKEAYNSSYFRICEPNSKEFFLWLVEVLSNESNLCNVLDYIWSYKRYICT